MIKRTFLYFFSIGMIFHLSSKMELKAHEKVEIKQKSQLFNTAEVSFQLDGYLRKRIDKTIQQYLLVTPESSPAILQLLRDRDRFPPRKPLMPWAGEFAGKYLISVPEGKSIIEFPRHRWEAIHDWQVLGELYKITGNIKYRSAMEKIWRCGVEGDRHNTGGITAGEGFTGSPYNQGAIETCCTVAWTAFSADALRITGNC